MFCKQRLQALTVEAVPETAPPQVAGAVLDLAERKTVAPAEAPAGK